MQKLRAQAVELLAGFESQLYHSPAVHPRASYLTSLCFSFFTYEMNVVMVLSLKAYLDVTTVSTSGPKPRTLGVYNTLPAGSARR